MGAEERVPGELWLEILGNLREYADRKTLSNFSVASHTFRSAALPLLFHKFRFTPYYIASKATLLLPSPTKIDQHLERLAFWTSPEIAPFVRYCDISAKEERYGETTQKAEWSLSTDTPYTLLDALFERLAQFTGLKQLRAHHIHFTQARVDILCRLPILPFELGIHRCSVAPGERIDPSPHGLRVSNFTLWHSHHSDDGGDHWIPLLHPEHLHSLNTDFDPRCMGRPDAIPFFPNVHRLTAKLHPTPSQNQIILSKFPAIRILKIEGKPGDLSPGISAQTPPILPLLREYSGPHQILPMLTPAATLAHLRTSQCIRADLITTLRGMGTNSIVSFHMKFSHLNSATFTTLVELLPHLTELVIHITVNTTEPLFGRDLWDLRKFKLKGDEIVDGEYGDNLRVDFKPSTFFRGLSNITALPSGLERLAISWECYRDECYGQRSAYRLPKFDQLRDTLVERCPRLNWVFFHGYYCRFQWQITPDGAVKEETKTKFLEAYSQDYGPDAFWDQDYGRTIVKWSANKNLTVHRFLIDDHRICPYSLV
ncbi:hypothetical protein C8R46DRAFT_1289352 [Mycena filopes]|nr:hypothetical protein C8R46DRAFT_1289352 [Mycena filopes]